ncbi:GATOR complex protein wdr59 [Coemansia sp. RSA 1813]|nr:GATOR complex protein wdr59 [Coemansia sp. RSA 1843]KAJ2088971.1 GATOR complex protein wdr59 [Coemansia sp. RSA 986]KAJ2569488.1 GATOR complex protein wdr59 [Coemansia sp. RSA 1813]
MVCGIKIERDVASVWFETEEAATSALNNLGNSELYLGVPLEHAAGSTNDAPKNAPIEVIVLDDRDDRSGDNDSVQMISNDSDSESSMISVDMLRPSDPFTAFAMSMNMATSLGGSLEHNTSNSIESGESHVQTISQRQKGNVARKSTGGRPPAPRLWSTTNKSQPKKLCSSSSNDHHYSFAESETNSNGPRMQESCSGESEYGGLEVDSLIPDFFKMELWRAKAPFIYSFLYRQLPGASAIDKGRHCLSMAWKPGASANMLDLYVSQGNQPAVDTIRAWGKDYNSNTRAKSEIAMTSFQLPARGALANVCSLLNAFSSKEAGTMHKNRQHDDNEFAVSTLKLYDHGRILFGCGTSSIIVWDTNGIKHKESLMVLADVDGVYDVGRDYVVANSTKGEMGVWRSGSRNYMWRYNDTRKFKTSSGSETNTTPVITALQVDTNDSGAFVGEISGRVSHSDFRAPHICRLSPNICAGAPRSFANAGKYGLLVGTNSGYLALFDTRYIHSSPAKLSMVKKFAVPESSSINRIRVCPHDPDVFACSIDRNVYIYRKEADKGNSMPLFCHHAHQSHVVDFDWHPSWEYKYTIGSAESGERLDSGEIQIWEPSSIVL